VLNFPDDTQAGVIGLDDTMAELYTEGRKVSDETAEEIIKRLEAKKNYIPSSGRARKEYSYVLLKEYRNYVKDRSGAPGGGLGRERRNDMENLLKQFKALTNDEKIAFMKEAMAEMAEIFANDPQKMMAEMMPFCMKMMKSKGMGMDRMRAMMKSMMG
jgi:hypothetical protein